MLDSVSGNTQTSTSTTNTPLPGVAPLPATPYSHPEFFRPPLVYPDVPFHEMLARTVLRVPDRPAIYWRDMTLTYRELYALVRSAAAALHELGLRKGDRLCLLLPNRPEYSIAWMAASMLGVVLSPMNPSYKEREIAYQLENTGAVAILVQRDLLPLVQAVRDQTPALRHILVTGSEDVADDASAVPFGRLIRSYSPERAPIVHVRGDDLLALPYSSGTTGLP
ncbi:MAG: AMP-binding protein, partial [Ktedonobacterales bacterium]